MQDFSTPLIKTILSLPLKAHETESEWANENVSAIHPLIYSLNVITSIWGGLDLLQAWSPSSLLCTAPAPHQADLVTHVVSSLVNNSSCGVLEELLFILKQIKVIWVLFRYPPR